MGKLKINYDNLYILFIIAIVVTGIIFRVIFYSYGRPLYVDEGSLALNIINLNNYFQPLNHEQACPPLFMYISKLVYLTGNILNIKGEYSLRLIPLLSSILSIPVFYFVVKKILTTKISQIIAVFLFVFNHRICYYAQEFKQYSTEVLIFLLIIAGFLYIDTEKINLRTKVLIGLLLGICIWISNAAAIIACAIGIIYLIKTITKKTCWKDFAVLILPAAISALLYLVIMHKTMGNEYLYTYWGDFFIKYNLSNLPDILVANSRYFFARKYIPLILALLGFIFFIRAPQKEKNLLITLPVLILAALSYMHIYPLGDRVVLFLQPVYVIYICKTVEVALKENKYLAFVILFLALTLSMHNFARTSKIILTKDYIYENIYELLKQSEPYIKSGDTLFVIIDRSNWEYYIRFFNLPDVKIIRYYPGLDAKDQNPINRKIESAIERTHLDFYKKIAALPKSNYYFLMAGDFNRDYNLEVIKALSRKHNGQLLYIDNKNNALFHIEIK